VVISQLRVPRQRGGRTRDESRDAAILQAAGDLLAEVGYEHLTMDAVAARAGAGKATLYRRWPSKSELIADAVASCTPASGDGDALPDTGSLRGDLLALAVGRRAHADTRELRIMGGLLAAVPHDPALAAIVAQRFLAPQRRLLARVFTQAVERGEVPAGRDVDVLAKVAPAMVFHRVMVEGGRVDDAFVLELIDQIIVPLATAPVNPDRKP
jgi:AcrR family transcriptional regulator